MTFIASVIARDGVAIIADSLVTRSSEFTAMMADDFIKFIEEKRKEAGDENINLSPNDLVPLFKKRSQSLGTRDFAEKLFKYNKHTAITTAGNAEINSKNIKDIINAIIASNNANPKHSSLSIEEKVEAFRACIEKEVKEQLDKGEAVGVTSFIISHYNRKAMKGQLFRVDTRSITVEEYQAKPDAPLVTSRESNLKIECDGQDRVSEALLFGTIGRNYVKIMIQILNKVFQLLEITDEQKKIEIAEKVSDDEELVNILRKDLEILKIRELSLQEAVDLAGLLMAVVRDFQKYTEDISKVGGQIKTAVIDNTTTGFRFIDGHNLKSRVI